MPYLPPTQQPGAEHRKADAEVMKRLANEQKRQQEAEEKRRREERQRNLAAEARLRAASTTQKR